MTQREFTSARAMLQTTYILQYKTVVHAHRMVPNLTVNVIFIFRDCLPHQFGASNTLEPLLKTSSGTEQLFVVNDHYSKLTCVLLSTKSASNHLSNIFLDSFLHTYIIQNYILSYNDLYFVSKMFTTLCNFFELKELNITMCNWKRCFQVERYIGKILQSLHHYISIHQKD